MIGLLKRILLQGALLLLLVFTSACSSAAAAPTPNPAAEPSSIPSLVPSPQGPTPTLPPAWAGQGYTGHLILIASQQTGNQVVEIDLVSGATKTLFQAPQNSWLVAAAVSPDGQQILLTYAPPPSDGSAQLGYSDLYLLPASGGEPQPFLTHKDPEEVYFDPAWSPDGKAIYYTHLYRLNTNSKVVAYQNDIERTSLAGKVEKLIPHALRPVVSPDGTKLSYLNEDPATFGNDLYQANSDGSQLKPILPPGMEPPIDAHLYSKDGKSLFFSMVNPQTQPARSWFDWVFGVDLASAHSVPSDWYRIPITGGGLVRMTNLNDIGLNAGLSPDGTQIAFIGSSGLYIMNLEGSNLFKLSNQLFVGTVNWIP